MEVLKELIANHQDRLFFHSPYNFLRALGEGKNEVFIQNKLNSWLTEEENYHLFNAGTTEKPCVFLYQFLTWDSNYFNIPTYKLFTVLYGHLNFQDLCLAVKSFKTHLAHHQSCYCFIEIAAEDIRLAQALTAEGFRLTETRLTYYHDQVASFNYPRHAVRAATPADIPSVKQVASQARNNYDRYHADIAFTETQADAYLATYAEACVNGLCETVLVPDEPGIPAEAFLAISQLQADAKLLESKMARVVLTAVGPACKGWHVKLVSETVHYAKEHQCEYVLMTTQATNRAVFRTSEKLGFKLGSTTHLLSINL